MSQYFQYFPSDSYDFFGNGEYVPIVDIYRNAITDSDILDDSIVAYTFYEIQNGERPDNVSQKLYKTTNYHWTFFIINPPLRMGMANWPLSDYGLEQYISDRYDRYSVIEIKRSTSPASYIFPYPSDLAEPNLFIAGTPMYNSLNNILGLDRKGVRLAFVTNYNGSPTHSDYSGHSLELIDYDHTRNQLIFNKTSISKCNVITSGTGYMLPPKLSIVSSDGTGCKIESEISSGSITAVRIIEPGNNYKRQSYPVRVHHKPTEEARIRAYFGGSSEWIFEFVERAVPTPDGETYYRGNGYCKVPTIELLTTLPEDVLPPISLGIDSGGRLYFIDGGSPEDNPADLVVLVTNVVCVAEANNRFAFSQLPPEVQEILGFRETGVVLSVVSEEDSILSPNILALTPPEDMISGDTSSAGSILNAAASMKFGLINPYYTYEEGYTTVDTSNIEWCNNVLKKWYKTMLPYSYFNNSWYNLTGLALLDASTFSIKAYKAFSSMRYAPYEYLNSLGESMTILDAQTASPDSITSTSFGDNDIRLNDEKRSIRVLSPEYVTLFADKYRDIINQ